MQTLSRRKLGWLISAFVLLLFSYLLLFINFHRIQKQYDLLSNTYTLLNRLTSMKMFVKDIGIQYRNYVLLSKDDSKQSYENIKHSSFQMANEIERLIADNSKQKENTQLLKQGLKALTDQFDEKAVASQNNRTEQLIVEYVKFGLHDRQIQPLIDRLNVMENIELNLLVERNYDLDQFSSTINFINLICLGLVFLIIIWTFYNYNEQYRAMIVARQRSEDYKLELEQKIKALDIANKQINELKHYEKFIASGRVARTIAHEIRNPLTNINLATHELENSLQSPVDKSMVSIVVRNSQRINEIINNLLNATRESELIPEDISLDALLEGALSQAKEIIDFSNIRTEIQNSSATTRVRVDKEKMQNALVNVIMNAADAMNAAEGNLLIIKTGLFQDAEAEIMIKDNGVGMNKEQLSKIFDPFFSQKTNVMGLGLTNTQNIIYAHRGRLQVNSKEGEGTSFSIFLPVSK